MVVAMVIREPGSKPCRLLAGPPPRAMPPSPSSARHSRGSLRPTGQVRASCLCHGDARMPCLPRLTGEGALAELKRKALLERLELELDLQVVDRRCVGIVFIH